MMTPLMAAYKHVPKLPQPGPEDPGPFAFASEERVRGILGGAGFADIRMEACPLSFDVAAGRGIDGAVEHALQIGPASRALEGHPPEVVGAADPVDPRGADAVRQGPIGVSARRDLGGHRARFLKRGGALYPFV